MFLAFIFGKEANGVWWTAAIDLIAFFTLTALLWQNRRFLRLASVMARYYGRFSLNQPSEERFVNLSDSGHHDMANESSASARSVDSSEPLDLDKSMEYLNRLEAHYVKLMHTIKLLQRFEQSGPP